MTEINFDTLSFCVHGTPVKFECAKCHNEHRLKLLESKINNLTEWKERQLNFKAELVDEIHRVKKKIDEIDHWRRSIMSNTIISNERSSEERIERIEKIIPRYDELHTEWCNRIDKLEQDLIDISSPLLERIEEIENGLINRIGILGTALQELSDEIHRVKKEPHKCPVCDGCGMRATPLRVKNYENTMIPINLDCMSCEGKGIIWS